MLFLKVGHKALLVLEPGNIERIKQGKALTSPDGSVGIAYTPDPQWLSDELQKTVKKEGQLSVETLEKLLNASLTRPEVGAERPYHEPVVWTDPKKTNKA